MNRKRTGDSDFHHKFRISVQRLEQVHFIPETWDKPPFVSPHFRQGSGFHRLYYSVPEYLNVTVYSRISSRVSGISFVVNASAVSAMPYGIQLSLCQIHDRSGQFETGTSRKRVYGNDMEYELSSFNERERSDRAGSDFQKPSRFERGYLFGERLRRNERASDFGNVHRIFSCGIPPVEAVLDIRTSTIHDPMGRNPALSYPDYEKKSRFVGNEFKFNPSPRLQSIPNK